MTSQETAAKETNDCVANSVTDVLLVSGQHGVSMQISALNVVRNFSVYLA